MKKILLILIAGMDWLMDFIRWCFVGPTDGWPGEAEELDSWGEVLDLPRINTFFGPEKNKYYRKRIMFRIAAGKNTRGEK